MSAAADMPPPVETVIIDAARLPPPASEPAFSVVKLDQTEIAPYDHLDIALKQIPALSLFRRTSSFGANPTTQGVSLRAIAPSGAGRTLVTLDGVPQNDPFGGWVIWSSLPPEAIEGVTVVRGAGAGPYGAGALTGVIALDETGAPSGIAATAQAGSLGQWRAAGAGGTTVGPVGLFLSGSIEHGDGWVPVHEGAGAADVPLELDAWSTSGRLQTVIGRAVLALRAGTFQEERSAGLVGANSEASGTTVSLTAAAAPEAGALGWRLQGWYRQSNLRNTSVAVAPGRATTTPANNQYRTPAEGWGFNAALRGASNTFEWETGADLRATQGETQEQFRYMAGNFTRDRVAGGDTLVAGGYAEAAWTSSPWLITGGARIDWWSSTDAHRLEHDIATGAVTLDSSAADKSGTVPSVRAGTRYDFNNALYLRSAAYAGFRPPTLNELHRSFRVGNDITQANPELKPEHLYGIEAAFGASREDFSWEANVFYNQLDDAIANVTIGIGPGVFPIEGFVPAGGTLRKRENAGRIDAYGVEARIEKRWTDWLSTHLALNYTDATVDGGDQAPQLTGKRPAQAPRFSSASGVDVMAPFGIGVHVDLRYESARFEDDLNTRRLDAAFTVDARVDYQLTEGVFVYGAVDNLFNANVQTGQTADGIYSYGPPQLWRIGLAYRR